VFVFACHHWCLMLAYGRRCSSECERAIHEQWWRKWDGGFFSWIPGCIDDDSDVKSNTVCVVEVQGKP